MDENAQKRAKRRALHLLERMDRTEQELRERLARDGYAPDCVDAAVAYVYRFHYLDDYRYACNYIRCRMEKYSKRQLRGKLAAKGVDSELIARALEEEYTADEAEQIQRILVRRQFQPNCGQKDFARTCQYLMRRGFEGGAVLSAMKNFVPSPDLNPETR